MSYKAPPYTLPPGERVTIQVVGREVAVIEADKDFLIATNSGEPEFIAAGLQLAPEGGFHNIVMRNPHVDPINVRLGITDGAIKDNRASVTTTLPVRDPDDLSSFSDINASLGSILAMMQNGNDKKRANTPIGESFFAGDTIPASLTTVVDPATNTEGVIIRTFEGQVYSANFAVFAGPSAPSSMTDVTVKRLDRLYGGNTEFSVRDLYLPAGQGLWLWGDGGGISPITITWDNLV